MKLTFRMVVSQSPDPNDRNAPLAPQFYAQRVSVNRVMQHDDYEKAVIKAANGRQWWWGFNYSSRTRPAARAYWVFRGSFVNGEYRGRCSSPRTFYIAVPQ